MPSPNKHTYKNYSAFNLPLLETDVADESTKSKIDSSTFCVREKGMYFYHPSQPIEDFPTTKHEMVIQEHNQTAETDKEKADSDIQMFTLVTTENSDGELNYILAQEENRHHTVDINVEEETIDINDFVEIEEIGDVEQESSKKHKRIKAVTKRRKINQPESKFTCNFCTYSTRTRYLLLRHMKCHSDARPHKCPVCDRGFKTQASLQNHRDMHDGVKRHACKACDAKFTTSGELVRHVRYRHTREKPHKCLECDYAAVELCKLRRHSLCHSGERPHQCPHCTYAAADFFKLKRHARVHTGEKPYVCDQCGSRFTQSNSLKTHKLIHTATEPMFTCAICSVKCNRKYDMRNHIQNLHTEGEPQKCKRCEKYFFDKYSLKMHTKTHVRERFECDLCPYATIHVRHLKAHTLLHTREKPFKCGDCNKSFRQKQLLRRHRNIYHNPDYVPKTPKTKNYMCPNCDRSFAHQGYLTRHLRVHDLNSKYYEQQLALKLGRLNKVQYVNSETMKTLTEEITITRPPSISDDSLSGENLIDRPLLTLKDLDGQEFVIVVVTELDSPNSQSFSNCSESEKQQAEARVTEVIVERMRDVKKDNNMRSISLPNNQIEEMEIDVDCWIEDEKYTEESMQLHIPQQTTPSPSEWQKNFKKDVENNFGFMEEQSDD